MAFAGKDIGFDGGIAAGIEDLAGCYFGDRCHFLTYGLNFNDFGKALCRQKLSFAPSSLSKIITNRFKVSRFKVQGSRFKVQGARCKVSRTCLLPLEP
jgi:hypothetical protein